jgi:hypothetical protein
LHFLTAVAGYSHGRGYGEEEDFFH